MAEYLRVFPHTGFFFARGGPRRLRATGPLFLLAGRVTPDYCTEGGPVPQP